jgi:hypothetical protein
MLNDGVFLYADDFTLDAAGDRVCFKVIAFVLYVIRGQCEAL